MELMDRRNALLQILGGSAVIGEFSKYQRLKVTPSENTNLTFSHNLGVVPKAIFVDSNQTYVSTTFLYAGVFSKDCGCMVNLSSNGGVVNGFNVRIDETGSSNSYCYMSSSSVVIRRATSAKYFDTNTEYTVDIYA